MSMSYYCPDCSERFEHEEVEAGEVHCGNCGGTFTEDDLDTEPSDDYEDYDGGYYDS